MELLTSNWEAFLLVAIATVIAIITFLKIHKDRKEPFEIVIDYGFHGVGEIIHHRGIAMQILYKVGREDDGATRYKVKLI